MLPISVGLPGRLQDINNEIQNAMSANYALPDEIDEDELMGELDGLEDDLAAEMDTAGGTPSYLQVLLSCFLDAFVDLVWSFVDSQGFLLTLRQNPVRIVIGFGICHELLLRTGLLTPRGSRLSSCFSWRCENGF